MNGEMRVIMIRLCRHLFTFHVCCLRKYDFFLGGGGVYTPFLPVFQLFSIVSHFILFQLTFTLYILTLTLVIKLKLTQV